MNQGSELSKQQLKSKTTKDKIFHAAKEILQKEGYESLSIKYICELAGVSNGSFYHHFQTKDDLLSYYIEHQPVLNPDRLAAPNTLSESIQTIIQVYLNYADYCIELGVPFVSNYYTPKNDALNPHIRTERAYPIVTVQNYLEKAISQDIISSSYSIAEITTDIRMLVIGNVFEWCMKENNMEFKTNIARSIGAYLRSVLK